MKNILVLLLTFTWLFSGAQDKPKIYDPSADAEKDVAAAIKKAGSEDKHVLLMIGGNWCPWCVKLNAYIQEDFQVDSTLEANYIWQKVNYSKENKNLELLRQLELPQRMGFPVLVVLDSKGKRIHTQNSWYLEKDKSYDRDKILSFLKEWGPAALDIENYKDYRK